MINLRPGNVPGLLRGADLRAGWGDTDGALEFLTQALQATPDFETRRRGLDSDQDGQCSTRNRKHPRRAEKLDEEALGAFPDYYAALESLARVRVAQHRYAEAVELLEKRNASWPRPGSLYRRRRPWSAGAKRPSKAGLRRVRETGARRNQPCR